MQKTEGYFSLILPDQPIFEKKTFTCSHCNKIKQWTDDGRHWCDTCDGTVCNECANDKECIPWKRRLDEAEARSRFRSDLCR